MSTRPDKFKILTGMSDRSFEGRNGPVPIKFFLASIPGWNEKVKIEVMGQAGIRQIPPTWAEGATIPVEGFELVEKDPYQNQRQFQVKFPQAPRPGFGGGGGRAPLTEINLDEALGLILTVYGELYRGLDKVLDERAWGEKATVAQALTSTTIIAMGLHVKKG